MFPNPPDLGIGGPTIGGNASKVRSPGPFVGRARRCGFCEQLCYLRFFLNTA